MNARLPIYDRSTAPQLPYPRGWYAIVDSADLARSEVKPVKVFGREVVVFRTEDGEAHVVNAFCPHLGAHLGYGGRVVGDRLRCPFHGWEFEGRSGVCKKAAHGDPAPAKAGVKRWHVSEHSGIVFVWYHDEGAPPDHELPPQPDFDLEWGPWQTSSWECKARIQDVGENDTDVSHSPIMHGLTDEMPELEMETNGIVCDLTMQIRARRDSFGLPDVPWALNLLRVPKTIPATVKVRRSGFSMGLIRQFSELPGGFKIRTQSFMSTTPIDAQHVRIVARHRVGKLPSRRLTRLACKTYAKIFDTTIEEDFEVWEHKIYRMRPLASKSDWAVVRFRKWARQFYAEGVCEDAIRHEDEMRKAGTLL